MLHVESFAQLGLYIARDFFNATDCAAVRAEVAAVRGSLGTIHKEGLGELTDPKIRNVQWHTVSHDTTSRITMRFQELQPLVSQHFGVGLQGFENIQFLCYKPGDFYLPHRDASTNSSARDSSERKVSVVVFLNSAMTLPDPHTYGGGSLTFYGLVPDPRWNAVGFGLDGVEGLLVAFRSDILHEVTPVTHGKRYTLVTWYY